MRTRDNRRTHLAGARYHILGVGPCSLVEGELGIGRHRLTGGEVASLQIAHYPTKGGGGATPTHDCTPPCDTYSLHAEFLNSQGRSGLQMRGKKFSVFPKEIRSKKIFREVRYSSSAGS